MSIERIIIKEKRTKEETQGDKVFYSLVKIMINDYFRIQEEYRGCMPYEAGKEFTTHLHGALILLEPSEKEIKKYCRKLEHFEPVNLTDENFVSKLESNLKSDGARIIKENNLMLKASVYAHYYAEKKEGRDITEIIKRYTVPLVNFQGERETAALAFSIAAKKNTFIISQTIQPAQEEKTIGTGKVAEIGQTGLVRTVKLENYDGDASIKHFLDKKVYILQCNYNFNGSTYLSSRNYLALEDTDAFVK